MMVRFRTRFAQPTVLLAVTTIAFSSSLFAQDVEEAQAEFIERMAANHGFERSELESLFADVTINERILESISRPAERVLAWHEYRNIFVTEERIASGAVFWQEHRAEIAAAADAYGVAPEILVAILGVETRFGTRMGVYRVLEALSTLAFAYPPRSRFFGNELEAFLLLAREEQLDVRSVLGSYAGAMGAGQFIPTSYRAFAVDGNADGRRDLWNDWEDVLGSVANYFKSHGWRTAEPVIERATLRPDGPGVAVTNSMDLNQTVGTLSAAGYVFSTDLSDSTPATVLELEGSDGTEYWIGFHNFRVITRYNRSVMYALAVKQLADEIVSAGERAAEAVLRQTVKDSA